MPLRQHLCFLKQLSDFGSARALPVEQQIGPQDLAKGPTLIHFGAFAGGNTRYVGSPQHIAPELLGHVVFVEAKARERAASGDRPALLGKYVVDYTTKC